MALGHALTHNHTLEELDITHNRIHAPALYEFLKGLLQNKGLQSLKVSVISLVVIHMSSTQVKIYIALLDICCKSPKNCNGSESQAITTWWVFTPTSTNAKGMSQYNLGC